MRSPDFLRRGGFWAVALLLGLTVLAYLPAVRGGFIWDDDTYLTSNRAIRASDGLYQFWCTTRTVDYWPVTTSTLWLEWRLWGMQAAGYHATNVALHAAEALLLWAILRRLRVPGAYLAALLFAVHPVNVESVAWITQRKNVMAMLFYLISILWFLKAEDSGELVMADGTVAARRMNRWYWLSVGAFLLGMLSKGSVAVLPGVLLGILAWNRRLSVKDGIHLAPFFGVAAAMTAVDVWSQHNGLTEVIRTAGPLERLLGAAAAVWFYLSKALLPVNLLFIYPNWNIRVDRFAWWLPLFGAVGMTAVLWSWRKGPGRAPLFAWAYFGLALAPVLGFTDVYFFKYSLVADHYQHLALIGVIVLVAAGLETLAARLAARAVPIRIGEAVLVAVLAVLTWRQCGIYRDLNTLYRATLAGNPDCWVFHNNLGNLLADAGQSGKAVAEYRAALRLNPDFPEAHNNLGNAFDAEGRYAEAAAEDETALRLNPNYAGAHNDLGLVLAHEGRMVEAVAEYRAALRINPDFPACRVNYGAALAGMGRSEDAIAQDEAALRLDPGLSEARVNLGLALSDTGKAREAIIQYEQALRLDPNFADAHNDLGFLLGRMGRFGEALPHFEAAVRLDPDDRLFRRNLEICRERLTAAGDGLGGGAAPNR